MQKLSGTISLFTFLSALILGVAVSCRFFQPTAQFFIVNESQDKKAVDLMVTLGGHKLFDDSLRYNDVRPYLSYTSSTTLSKGKYVITVTGDNGKIHVQQPVMVDTDLFIFITYDYKMPGDSVDLVKKYGYASSDSLKEQAPKVDINITDKEPVHL